MIEVEAYKTGPTSLKLVPGEKARDWLPKHAYKCLPVTVANEYGYDLVTEADIKVTWNGREAVQSLTASGCGAKSHFGGGTFTLDIGLMFKTPEGFGTRLSPCPNSFNSTFVPMTAFVETDKLDYPFFLTVKMLLTGTALIPKGTILGRLTFERNPDDSRIVLSREPRHIQAKRDENIERRRKDDKKGEARFYHDLPIKKNFSQRVIKLELVYEKVLVIDDFLSPEQCAWMVDYAKSKPSTHLEDDPFWDNRIWHDAPHPPDIKKKLSTIRDLISAEFRTKAAPPESSWQIVRWQDGLCMPLHMDYGAKGEYPNREFASIIYLNDDYLGGQTYLKSGEVIIPKTGRLVIFRGGSKPHGVRTVTGDRFTCINWHPEVKK